MISIRQTTCAFLAAATLGAAAPAFAQAASGASAPPSSVAFQQLAGRWTGQLTRGGGSADLAIELEVQDGQVRGVFDWPDLGYLRTELLGVRETEGEFRFALPLPLGHLRLRARLQDGRLIGVLDETTRVAGAWTRLPEEGDFVLTRSAAVAPPYDVTPVRFNNGTVTLGGEVFTPRSAAGPRPAVVFIHGSGDSARGDGRYVADQLARAGIVTLIYDKRGVGDSGGQWREGGYEDLAADAAAARAVLMRRADVDPDRVGYVCRSEGCWVAPIAIRSGGAGFLAAISGPTISVIDEDIDHYRVALREAGASETAQAEAFALIRLRHGVVSGAGDVERFRSELARLKGVDWFPVLAWDDDGLEEAAPFRVLTLGFDPGADLAAMRVPSLWLYGTDDVIIPVGDSVARLVSLKLEPRPTIMLLPRADHALAAIDYPRLPGGVGRAASLLAEWINQQ